MGSWRDAAFRRTALSSDLTRLFLSLPTNSWPVSTYRSVFCSRCFVYLTRARLESIRKVSLHPSCLSLTDGPLEFPSKVAANCRFATLKTPAGVQQSGKKPRALLLCYHCFGVQCSVSSNNKQAAITVLSLLVIIACNCSQIRLV